MTLFSELQVAGIPVIKATETGEIETGPLTPEQDTQLSDIVLQYFNPTAYSELLQDRANKQALQDAYLTMIARLEQIQAATSPTNAQVIQAIRDEALYIERIMKIIKRMVT